MSRVCEHEFDQEDPFNRGYSMTEFDLSKRLNLAIRKNLGTGIFEIFDLRYKKVVHQGTLREIVEKANELERDRSIKMECGEFCPKKREQKSVKDFGD